MTEIRNTPRRDQEESSPSNSQSEFNPESSATSPIHRTTSFAKIDLDSVSDVWVVGWVVERKEALDLATSITGGRLSDQLAAQQQLGLNAVLLIEGDSTSTNVISEEAADRYYETLLRISHQANCYDQGNNIPTVAPLFGGGEDGTTGQFTIHHTRSIEDTASYLATFTHQLHAYVCCYGFESGMSFAQFNAFPSQTGTVSDCFVHMIQQIPGCSDERLARAIAREYPTPRCLFEAMQQTTSKTQRQRILEQIYIDNTAAAPSSLLSQEDEDSDTEVMTDSERAEDDEDEEDGDKLETRRHHRTTTTAAQQQQQQQHQLLQQQQQSFRRART
eukprot:TRINITY_DN3868_c0_g1_i1.p2 TRINITY_DN3868_c0_g1~~TRINITY_DN3868_c0_g1_i1.p2  ORF type:complete len:332 (+),score=90.68 TRINITY_DN3868_c0_g1_i1:2988-3983(+)